MILKICHMAFQNKGERFVRHRMKMAERFYRLARAIKNKGSGKAGPAATFLFKFPLDDAAMNDGIGNL